MSCGCKDNFLPYNTRVQRAYVAGTYDFHADTPWMPAFEEALVSIRLLAEQSDGVDVIPAYQTASYRFDQSNPLGDWTTIGTVRTTEGDSSPETIQPTITDKFWIRFGHGIKVPTSSAGIGVASVGTQWSFPTERHHLLVGPSVVNAYDNPVGDAYTELMTTEWMPFYSLAEIRVAYQVFDADSDFRYTIVLQSVKTDPSQESPSEDTIKSAQTGDGTDVEAASTFTNASSNNAQLCRVVLKADNNTAGAQKRGRVYIAVAAKYN